MEVDEHAAQSEAPAAEGEAPAEGAPADAAPADAAPADAAPEESPQVPSESAWTESPPDPEDAARGDLPADVPAAESLGDLPPPEPDAAAPDAPARAHDARLTRANFFRALLSDSQRARGQHMAERERWVRGLEMVGPEEVLHELDMYLRGLMRYFNLHNLPGDREDAAGRDFRFELRAIRDALNRSVHLTRKLTVPRAESGLVFRAFVQSQLEDDRIRGRLVERQLEQRTPDESLFLLRTSLGALRGTVDALLKLETVPLSVFNDLGVLLDRELLGSRYFHPPGPLEFRYEYDRLASVPVLESLRELPDHRSRRAVAFACLSLYRLLRDLAHVPAPPAALPRRSLIVLALAKSEAASLAVFLETDLPRLVAAAGAAWQEAARGAAAELRAGVGDATAALAMQPSDRSAIDSARGALNDAAERAISRLAEVARPGVSGMELFEGPNLRRLASDRLRRDLWVFRELCTRASEEPAEGAEDGSAAALQSLQIFAAEFLDVGYQFIRFGDHPNFDRFLDVLHDAPGPDADAQVRRRFILETRRFSRYLDRTFQQISRRAELVETPPDPDLYASVLDRYLGAA